jgi:hypothetical protein
MKHALLLIFTILLFAQCTSIKSHNKHLSDLISEKNLKSDVDCAYNSLQKLHPNLYWYISKEALDSKFDSLKASIQKPMTSFDFFQKISPVIAAIKQGHISTKPPLTKFTKKEDLALSKKGIGPLLQFDFEIFDNKLYVSKNKSYDKTIQRGTEIAAINGIKTTDLL